MRHTLLLVWCLLSYCCLQAQQTYTVNGYIRDAANGEEIIGATVYIKEHAKGTASNPYGFYSLTLPAGQYTLVYSFVGYENLEQAITLTGNQSINIALKETTVLIEEVVVTAEREDQHVQAVTMSKMELDIDQVKKLPALFGEADIIKSVQMMPGVVSAGEGTSGYFVRGGSADQNLILIDEAPVYDPSHLFGLLSIFNADVIKDAELYKGGIPAQYGGRLSSLLEVRTKDGNNKKLAGSAGIGTLASRVMLEGPIKKDHSSFIVSGRRSYADLFMKLGDEETSENSVYFYDLNAKVNWRKNNKNRFYLAGYLGRDKFNFGDDASLGWGNATATFRWNHLFNDRLFSNTTLIYSNFDYKLEVTDDVEGLMWDAGLQETSFKEDLTYFIAPGNVLSFGYHVTWRRFQPGSINPTGEQSIFKPTQLERMFALDHAFYVGHEQQLGQFTLQYGLRYALFQNVGKSTIYEYLEPNDNINNTRVRTIFYDDFETIKTFHNLEPRFSARYLVNDNTSLKLSYNRMVQNVHLLSNATVPLPFNTWHPSSPYLEPQRAHQVAAGYFTNLNDNTYELSAEVFYKDMDHVTDFADNADVFFNEDIATEFRPGTAEAYGLELLASKKKGPLQGFAAYTLSKVTRTVPGANNGVAYAANYDRRHNMSLSGTYTLNDKWTFGANWIFNSGRPITLPAGRFEFENYNADFYTTRNGHRLPHVHRLDLSANLSPRKNANRKHQVNWVFSIYNAYNRKNPFTIYSRKKRDENDEVVGDGSEKELRLVYLFPIMPSVTYQIRF